ncbi:MAG TPA: hypothetical protein VIU86_19815 [Gaiellaceae bacterium]
MKIQDRILRRKIGVFELLLGVFPFELLFGSSSRAWLLLLLSIGFYFAKKEFKGEFSLLDLFERFTKEL